MSGDIHWKAARLALRDLRTLWCWARSSQGERPEVVERVRRIVRSSIVSLEEQTRTERSDRESLQHDLEALRSLASQIERGSHPDDLRALRRPAAG